MKCIINDQVVLSQPLEGPLAAHIAPFAAWVSEQGYAPYSLHRRVLLAACFSRWLGQLHRLRVAATSERTALCNRLRGLLAEYGIVLPTQGVAALRRRIPELLEDGENPLTPLFRRLLDHGYRQLLKVDDNILFYKNFVDGQGRNNEAVQRLRTIPSYGPIVASVFYATVGNGQGYHRGRNVSASLGIVPRQHSSGGKEVLQGIGKRGDSYLRGLLVRAARAVLRRIGSAAGRSRSILSEAPTRPRWRLPTSWHGWAGQYFVIIQFTKRPEQACVTKTLNRRQQSDIGG